MNYEEFAHLEEVSNPANPFVKGFKDKDNNIIFVEPSFYTQLTNFKESEPSQALLILSIIPSNFFISLLMYSLHSSISLPDLLILSLSMDCKFLLSFSIFCFHFFPLSVSSSLCWQCQPGTRSIWRKLRVPSDGRLKKEKGTRLWPVVSYVRCQRQRRSRSRNR